MRSIFLYGLAQAFILGAVLWAKTQGAPTMIAVCLVILLLVGAWIWCRVHAAEEQRITEQVEVVTKLLEGASAERANS